MAVKIPNSIEKLKVLCYKYQKQLKELTQKLERESLQRGMEEYYHEQKIMDFEALCMKHGIDYAIINERDEKRRKQKTKK